MNADCLDQLQALLAKPLAITLDAQGQLSLTFSDCTQADQQTLKEVLAQLQADAGAQAVNYSRYFDAVISSPMYKPANPGLALLQIAKAYDLELDAFKKAFKAAKG